MFSVKLHVEETVTVPRPPAEVSAIIADLSRWRPWSPWFIQEPEAREEVSGEAGQPGHRQTWEGQRIGSGELILEEAVPGERLEFALNFLKPWKSQSRTGFQLTGVDGATEVRWHLDSGIPFFLFFMKGMMQSLIRDDYRRGLAMLREYAETGAVSSRVEVAGRVPGVIGHYVGRRRLATMEELESTMTSDFSALEVLQKSERLPPPSHVFSIYHRFDFARGHVDYTAAYLYPEPPAEMAEDLVRGELPAHHAFKVVHTGPYRYLGNGWSTAMNGLRAEKLPKRKLPAYEVYANDPATTPAEALRTEIFIPVKG